MYQEQLRQLEQKTREVAREEGGQNRPSPNATVKSAHEDHIDAEARRHAQLATNELDKAVVDAEQQVQELAAKHGPLLTKCRQLVLAGGGEAEARNILSKQRQKLMQLQAKELTRLAELRSFKSEHHLTREAQYPESIIGALSFVFAALALEAALNAYFFSNEFGLIGGFATAVFVSIVNVGMACALGWWFRHKNHVRPLHTFGGWISFAVFVFWCIYFNSLIATFRFHYQEALRLRGDSTDPLSMTPSFQQALAEASRVFVLDPQFRDLESFLLFFVGVAVAGFAFYKGYTLDDRYPGYSDVSKPYDEATRELQPQIDAVRETLGGVLAQYPAEIQQARAELAQHLSRLMQLNTALATAKTRCGDQLRRITIDHGQLRDMYRSANNAIRTIAAPAYFGDLTPPISTEHDGGASTVLVQIREALERYEKMQDELQMPLVAAFQAAQAEAAQLQQDLFLEFKKKLRQDAEEQIATGMIVHPPLERS